MSHLKTCNTKRHPKQMNRRSMLTWQSTMSQCLKERCHGHHTPFSISSTMYSVTNLSHRSLSRISIRRRQWRTRCSNRSAHFSHLHPRQVLKSSPSKTGKYLMVPQISPYLKLWHKWAGKCKSLLWLTCLTNLHPLLTCVRDLPSWLLPLWTVARH